VTHAGGIGLVDNTTAESCADVTPAKTMSATIDTIMRCCQMTMEKETETLALGMELTLLMI
jgi:hypothetical protein